MTPEGARALLDGTTPGPWEVETVPEMRYYDGETWETPGKIVVYADEATLFVAADEFVGDEGDEHDNEKNVALAAAAPTLAAMIARMREEWGVAVTYPGLAEVVEWGYSQAGALEEVELTSTAPGAEYRVVRRYVTAEEEIS